VQKLAYIAHSIKNNPPLIVNRQEGFWFVVVALSSESAFFDERKNVRMHYFFDRTN
jgi:hypothetical protein